MKTRTNFLLIFFFIFSSFTFSQKGGFEDDDNDDTLFNSLAAYAQKGAIESLLNQEWEKQVASKTKFCISCAQTIVVQDFKIDNNNILSFSTKAVYENNCYPSNANCEVRGIYSITRQEVALKDIMYIGKDGHVQLLTKGEKDVKSTTKTYSTNGKLLEERVYLSSDFQTSIFLANNIDFGNKFVELMKKAGFLIERVAWHPN